MFATVVLATLELGSRQLSFCNAGHPPPYVVGLAGLTMLEAPRAIPIGIRPSFSYVTSTRRLEVGDSLFLFTDGVTEALDANGEFFSESRLEDVLRSVAEGNTQSVVTTVVDAVRRFAGSAPQSDDIAALAVRLVG
jgi:sigma-B regulation protein RsbU (phosphoserine phosphatase)